VIDDAAQLAGFQDGTLAHLSHVDHVRLAWLYLEAHEPADALARFAADLQRYAAARGVASKYSEAITRTWMARVGERRRAGQGWHGFAAANPDLMVFTKAASSSTARARGSDRS
jgi:hypothetical protein